MSKRLLLVAWDAADWRLLRPFMDGGKMPALRRLAQGGVSGSMFCGQPLVAAAQWTSLVTGKRPWQHRVCHQAQLEAGQLAPVSAAGRQSVALWEILQTNDKRSVIVGWPATHGSRGEEVRIISNRYSEPTAGPGIKPWPAALAGTYWPEKLGAILDSLRVSPEDMQADLLSHFVPHWKALDQKRDRRLSYLRMFLAADLSHHAAMARLLTTSDWDFAAIHFPSLGAITGMFLPFLSPRPDWVPEQEFRMYRQVVSSAYVMLDRLLQSLVQTVGKDTVVMVVSACGVSTHLPRRQLRASEGELWKSPYGWLVVYGPEFKSNSQLLGATILDLAPTILAWFRIPIGDDMEGRVLTESFANVQEVTRVKTWETKPEQEPETRQFRANYCPDKPEASLQLEYDWNLARSCLDAARHEEALPLLEKLFRSFPERAEFSLALFQCQLTLKHIAPAEQTLEVLLESLPPGIEPLFCRAELLLAQGRRKDAAVHVEQIRKLKPADPVGLRRLGMLLWRLRQWPVLAELSQAVLKLDPNESLAWLAQAEASLRLGQFSEAFASAQKAISLNYFLPQAHLILSRALLNQGKWGEAREAMHVVLHLQPGNRAAAAYWRRSGLNQQEPPAK